MHSNNGNCGNGLVFRDFPKMLAPGPKTTQKTKVHSFAGCERKHLKRLEIPIQQGAIVVKLMTGNNFHL